MSTAQDRISSHFESYLGKSLWKWLPMDVWENIFTISQDLKEHDRKKLTRVIAVENGLDTYYIYPDWNIQQ